jgi:hypothetical protein
VIAAPAKQPISVRKQPRSRAPRRLDLSVPFTVTLIAGFTSLALFLSVLLRSDVPPSGILRLATTDPFGALGLALLAAAGVMTRIGDI